VTDSHTDALKQALAHPLTATNFPQLGRKYEGKVRDNYTTADGRRFIVVTDRISAFDVVLGTIPFKGQVLNQIAAYWFEVTKHLASNHIIDVPDPTVTIATECEIIPIEFVMRSYVTGVTTTSIWYHYSHGVRRYCGHDLPEGMRKNQKLDRPILTPSTKAEKGGHDESLPREAILARGTIDAATFDEAAGIAARLFAHGQQKARSRGLILVDTKYELGRALSGPHRGRIVVIDEIHTPDSSRYWFADDYAARLDAGDEPRSLDKEYVRRWYAAQGYTGDGPPFPMTDDVRVEAARRYIEAYETITGTTFVPDLEDPAVRIPRNLGLTR